MNNMGVHQQKSKSYTFMDLFAGIGGFHLALHQLGAECVYASEWDDSARETYKANFQNISPFLFENDLFKGDITLEENQQCIPEDVDILCAGFPCQPFSQAGQKKGLAETRGTLFFEIAKIIKNKRPRVIFLENVRHLLKHDNGKTFKVICQILEEELNYTIYYKVLKASEYGLPTHRPRIYIVGFRSDVKAKDKFQFPNPVPLMFTMSDVFEGECAKEVGYTVRVGGRGSGINDRRNWDAYLVNGEVRYISPDEVKKMMGFPHDFKFMGSEASALKLLGNSVAINPVKLIAENIIKILEEA